MNAFGLLPIVAALLVAGVVPLAAANPRIDARLTRVARRYFGRYVPSEAPERTRRLRAAYVPETRRTYAAKTYLVTAFAALAGCVVGVYVAGATLVVLPAVGDFIDQLPDAMAGALGRPELDPALSEREVFAVLLAGGVAVGLLTAGVTYWWRWTAPASRAEARRRGIEEGLPRTVAFLYALSRGGMAMPEVLRTLAHNRDVYGHGADELSVAVREMDLFGRDIITAVRRVAARTPSEQFKTFAENLASVLQSGQAIPDFLEEQYEYHRDRAQERQDELLELLATIAEAYVTVLVAGTLFLMTILLVFGLTTTRTINFLRLLAYVAVPLANLLFVVYLDGKLDLLGVARHGDTGGLEASLTDRHRPADVRRVADAGGLAGEGPPDDAAATPAGSPGEPSARSDGRAAGSAPVAAESPRRPDSDAETRRQLAAYESLSRLRRAAGRPIRTILRRPTTLLYVTVPLALLSIALRAPAAVSAGAIQVRVLDDLLVQATLFVVGTFAVVWELYTRRIHRMESQLPEFLGRLGSLNQAGMSVVEAIERVRESDLGALSPEVDRVWRDVEYGATVDDALRRFGLRVRTTTTTRVVTLLTNALRASGNLAPIFRIAGEQAAAELRLRRRRRQEMLTYLVVIYVAFLVFLVIIVAVHEVLVPSLPTNVPTPSPEETRRLGVDAGAFARFGGVDKAAYTLVFFHTALLQAVLSGFVGGQLGEGSLKDGAKHAAAMLAVAYVAFLLLGSPVAQVSFADQSTTGDAVVVERVSLSDGGFVVVRQRTPGGAVVGHSTYLEPGTHEDVQVPIEGADANELQFYAVAHLDSDGDEAFGFGGADATDEPYTADGDPVFDGATVTLEGSRSVTGPGAGALVPGDASVGSRGGAGSAVGRGPVD